MESPNTKFVHEYINSVGYVYCECCFLGYFGVYNNIFPENTELWVLSQSWAGHHAIKQLLTIVMCLKFFPSQ